MLVCADLYEIPEDFLLSLTRIYLSSVITYSLMYNTLGWAEGGGGGLRWKRRSRGGKMYKLAYFPPFPLSAEPCLPPHILAVTHIPNPGRGLSRVLCIMKVDISPHISRPSDMNCCSVLPLVHLTRQHK